jgi:hypothetical protein
MPRRTRVSEPPQAQGLQGGQALPKTATAVLAAELYDRRNGNRRLPSELGLKVSQVSYPIFLARVRELTERMRDWMR